MEGAGLILSFEIWQPDAVIAGAGGGREWEGCWLWEVKL